MHLKFERAIFCDNNFEINLLVGGRGWMCGRTCYTAILYFSVKIVSIINRIDRILKHIIIVLVYQCDIVGMWQMTKIEISDNGWAKNETLGGPWFP